MKKLLCMLIAASLIISCLAGCGQKSDPAPQPDPEPEKLTAAEIYERFLCGDYSALYADDTEGLEKGVTYDISALSYGFCAWLQGTGFCEDAFLDRVFYADIDCGLDGEPEMALKIGDEIYTGSAAAGPAMEGQSIKCGMLAGPGAISDLEYDYQWVCKVLNDDIIPESGDRVDFAFDTVTPEGPMSEKVIGITGTGVIAAVAAAQDEHLWRKGKLTTSDGKLHLQDGVYIDSHDIQEAMKAIGAMRAGHFTLLEHAGVKFEDMRIMYMAGASGTYVDAVKARQVGLLPPSCDTIYQYGNTSLAMSTDILRNPELLDELQDIANGIRANHIMFAGDKIFEQIYMQELAVCDEGMSMETYNNNNAVMGIQALPKPKGHPNVIRVVQRDIPDLGERGLTILHDIGTELKGYMDGCIGCGVCEKECPEHALKLMEDKQIVVQTKKCLGTACYRCQFSCPKKVYKYDNLKLSF